MSAVRRNRRWSPAFSPRYLHKAGHQHDASAVNIYSARQADFSARVCFEARSDSEARAWSLLLVTALRGSKSWGKTIYLERLKTGDADVPVVSCESFNGPEGVISRLRLLLGRLVDPDLRARSMVDGRQNQIQ
jgi:hypothetical protein